MIQEEFKESVEYIRSTILPKLQEIQRDLTGMLNGVSINVSFDGQNGSVFSFVSVTDEYSTITDTCSTNFFFVDSKEELDKKYNELAEFLKKYLA